MTTPFLSIAGHWTICAKPTNWSIQNGFPPARLSGWEIWILNCTTGVSAGDSRIPCWRFGFLSAKNKRLRISLIGLNSAWYHSNPALYYLRGSLRGLPFEVCLREFSIAEPLFDILTQIIRDRPDVASFSAYVWNSLDLRRLIPELKKLMPGLKVVLGGPEATNGDFGLAEGDFRVKGPGEGVFRRLAESGFELPGGTYEAPAPLLSELPFLYRRSDRPALQGRLVYYESSRGCPFRCAYCLSALDKRNEARFDPSLASDRRKLRSELDRLLELKPRTLKFVDRSFNAHPRLARLIWEHAIRQKQSCEFHFEIYPDLLTEEDLRILEKAPPGRIRFEVGVQTVNAAVSRACGRNSNWGKVKAALNALRERTAICVHADLLVGLPGEKYASVLRSLDELASTFPAEIQLGMLKILPGTPMQEIASQRRYLWQNDPPWQVLKTDALSFEQVARLQELAKILNLYWNKGEFTAQWQELISAGNRASSICLRLLKLHRQRGLTLHSVGKSTRADVFAELLSL